LLKCPVRPLGIVKPCRGGRKSVVSSHHQTNAEVETQYSDHPDCG
jgi:hypothetical protein